MCYKRTKNIFDAKYFGVMSMILFFSTCYNSSFSFVFHVEQPTNTKMFRGATRSMTVSLWEEKILI